jgi:hypothetical protein
MQQSVVVRENKKVYCELTDEHVLNASNSIAENMKNASYEARLRVYMNRYIYIYIYSLGL